MTPTRLFLVSLLSVAALFVSGATGGAQAQVSVGPGPSPQQIQALMQIFDVDGDERVTATEIAEEQERLFGAIDVNGDGLLSVDEFRRNGRLLLALNVTTFFDLMDVNGNNELDLGEITQPGARWTQRYDADADGALNADELRAARLGIAP